MAEIVGGQAVMEGVMMINGKKKAIAVRNPKGKIVVRKEKFNMPDSKIVKIPFVRGAIILIFTMIEGIKAINYSTSVALAEDEEEIGGFGMFALMAISIVAALFLFKFIPLLATKFLVNIFPSLENFNLIPNIIDGVLKISIFILYLQLMGLSKETSRIFEYHGAEHKVIRCREAGKKLTPKNAKEFSRFHPRCGTAFIFGVFIISIFVFSIIPFSSTTFWQNFLLRILLLPVVMGISYEALKISGKNEDNLFFKIITAPGLWMQRFTTREPDEEQLAVSIKSLKSVL